ncbi:DUF3108 domain-containing protein [Telmatospirillum sp. J64-1]|uniref:DUF3108 domain-containing protein n=1 Tax=Telmatospirillum sp. J64-1 TaxID=2502183 RepID=UPI00115E8DA0|nr:DUF3108 domain-containing protein [Telmatospirillum sp. J64-1]
MDRTHARRRWFAPLALGLLGLLPVLATAEQPQLASLSGTEWVSPSDTVGLRYSGHWSGFRVGSMSLIIQEDPNGYVAQMELQSDGLMHRLSPLRVEAETRGVRDTTPAPGQIPGEPLRFQMVSVDKRKQHEVQVEFDPQSGLAVKTLDQRTDRDEDESEDELLPDELLTNVLDPLSMIVALRDQTAAAVYGNGPARFTVPSYDGRRRFDLNAEILGPGRHRAMETIRLRLTLTPRGGFKEKQIKNWQNMVIEAQLDSRYLLPVRFVAHGSFGAAVINLEQACVDGNPAGCSLARG